MVKLATDSKSLTHYTKGTQSLLAELPLLVRILGRPGKVIMRVFSGDMVFPHSVDVDLESPRYMMPTAYQIRAATFHHSRIIDFSYVRPPELDLPAYRYGGVSEFELIHGQLINDGIVERASVMALEKNSVPTIKVKGLKQSLQAGHESEMLKYFQVMEDAAHIAGARLIDGDDDIDLTTLTLTALAEADMIAMRRLSMVTGIPLPQLMGESVRGMNSSGETERLVFREMLMDLQNDFLRDPINQLMRKFGCGQVWFLENQGDTPGSRIAYEKTALENAKALYDMGEDHRAYLLEKDILKKDDMSRFFGGSDSADGDEVDISDVGARAFGDDFDESKVKRDEGGRFSSGGGGGSRDRPEGAFVSWSVDTEVIYDDEGEESDGEDYILIEKIEVPPEHRGRGIARSMLREELAAMQAEHPDMPIRLSALPTESDGIDMSDLVAFYESEGFDVISTDGPAVVMEFDGDIRGRE